ncbi:MAG: biopolymer transporter ExbD [bacterium]
MKLRRTVDVVKGPPDLAPLVGVVLLLFLFFLLTSSFVFQPGIKVELPHGVGAGGVSARYIVSISSQDPPLIFFNDQRVSMEDLGEKLKQISSKEADASLILKADHRVPHGVVVQAMNQALEAGLSIVIATQPGKGEPPASTPPKP